ncbi:MAG: hypothetical protein ACJAVM_002577 [Sulfitobacter sp.]|jgi:hypothetical protein
MEIVVINEPESRCLELFRMALSESTHDARTAAITVMKHEVVSLGLDSFPIGSGKTSGGKNSPEFVQWVAETSRDRYEAAHEFSAIARRYEARNERKLNIAEEVGKRVWDSIQAQEFKGLHVAGGILEKVRKIAKQEGIQGARDKDVLSRTWVTYRGVVHLGMAMDYCEDNPGKGLKVLDVAERFRQGLSQGFPKKTTKSYVSDSDQISFRFISNT